MLPIKRFRLSLSATLLALFSFPLSAQVAISPTSLAFSSDERFEFLTLHNDSVTDKTFHVSLNSWTQIDEQDHYEESNDLVIAPPIFVVPAGKSQTIRLARRSSTAQGELESAYKLIVTQVPALFSKELGSKNAGSVEIVLNFSLPVFIPPKQGGRAELNWRLTKSPQKMLSLALSNTGNMHIRVDYLKLLNRTGQTLFETDHFYNALAKGSLTFKTTNRSNEKNYKIKAMLNGLQKEFDVALIETVQK